MENGHLLHLCGKIKEKQWPLTTLRVSIEEKQWPLTTVRVSIMEKQWPLTILRVSIEELHSSMTVIDLETHGDVFLNLSRCSSDKSNSVRAKRSSTELFLSDSLLTRKKSPLSLLGLFSKPIRTRAILSWYHLNL